MASKALAATVGLCPSLVRRPRTSRDCTWLAFVLCFACGNSSGGGDGGSAGTNVAGAGGLVGAGGVASSGGLADAGGSTSSGTSMSSGSSTSSGASTGSGGATTGGGAAGAVASGGFTATQGGGATGAGASAGAGGATSSGGTTGLGGAGVGGTGADAGVGNHVGPTVTIKNGSVWNDTTSTKVQAHGGGFLKEGDTYYWVGEDKTPNTGGTGFFYAVSLYSSTDLVNWVHRNKIITTTTDPQLGASNRVIERPKIVYNDMTKTYVMWLHWDDTTYNNSYAGIFQSPKIDGNYTYVNHIKPGGHDSRDCTLFKDADGRAYFISVANSNRDMFVYPLTTDYLNVQQGSTGTNIFPGQSREAPAIVKVNGTYYAITSGSTGWAPNQGGYSTASSITGPWSAQKNIGDNTTFQSQSTFIITVAGSEKTTYIYAGDRWNSGNLSQSQYIWLPLTVTGTTLSMSYLPQWSLDVGRGVVTPN
jgi:hypothetical protein